jgi:hypothetical protein
MLEQELPYTLDGNENSAANLENSDFSLKI